jgi:polyhydroxybutyrate depolymerase
MRASLRTGRRLSLALWGAALVAMAPAPAAQEKTIATGGRVRTYRLYAPHSLPKERPSPLVLVFHGGEGDGEGVERLTGFDALADREGFLVAYPDGGGKHWNDGRENRDFETFREHVDDVAFVGALIDALSRDHAIDPKRIFATGISNGGIFSHYLAARLANRIAAIAPVAGGIAEPVRSRFRPEKPVSVLIIHGTEDPLVPYHGGGVRRGTHGRVLDTDEAARLWVAADACSIQPSKNSLPEADPDDGCRVDRTRWTGGRNGTEVVLYTVQGGGHTWPGESQYAPRIAVGRVCRDFDATQVIWEFFKTHPRP